MANYKKEMQPASDENTNLKGHKKAEHLLSLFGDKGFDYVGDSTADLAVWKHSRHAYSVSRNRFLRHRIEKMTEFRDLSQSQQSLISSLGKSLRAHQWVKNLLLFIPLFATHQFTNVIDIKAVLIAFVSFSLAASAIYLVNDVVDISHDRQHATKRFRPIASGQLSIPVALIASGVLLLVGFLLSLTLTLSFVMTLVLYVALTFAYSLGLKKLAIIDVVVLAALYTLRIVAGAFAISAPPSFWILTFSMFLFLSLALMKRYSELYQAVSKNSEGNVGGRGYSSKDLEYVSTLGVSTGLISVLVFMLYVNDSDISQLYTSPLILWLSGPLMLLWISRAWVIAHRGNMNDDPILFALKDWQSYVIAFLFFVVFYVALVF
jgi:4-hydroxybenzoate polyprenyltransferase